MTPEGCAKRWKLSDDEWLPYHPSASHIEPAYRNGWNAAYKMASAPAADYRKALEELVRLDDLKKQMAPLNCKKSLTDQDLAELDRLGSDLGRSQAPAWKAARALLAAQAPKDGHE